jgi:hypothetical protein
MATSSSVAVSYETEVNTKADFVSDLETVEYHGQ